jgi:hypothetical protein
MQNSRITRVALLTSLVLSTPCLAQSNDPNTILILADDRSHSSKMIASSFRQRRNCNRIGARALFCPKGAAATAVFGMVHNALASWTAKRAATKTTGERNRNGL